MNKSIGLPVPLALGKYGTLKPRKAAMWPVPKSSMKTKSSSGSWCGGGGKCAKQGTHTPSPRTKCTSADKRQGQGRKQASVLCPMPGPGKSPHITSDPVGIAISKTGIRTHIGMRQWRLGDTAWLPCLSWAGQTAVAVPLTSCFCDLQS